MADTVACPADVATIVKPRPVGPHLRHKSVGAAAVVRQVRPRHHREGFLVGRRLPRHVGVSGRVQRNIAAVIVGSSADVAAKHEPGPPWIHLRHKGVPVAVERRVRSDLHRKGLLGGTRESHHVDVPARVHRNVRAIVTERPPDEAAVHESGALGIHFRHESVSSEPVPAVEGQIGPDLHGKGILVAHGHSGDVGVSGRVHSDAVAVVVAVPTDVPAVDKHSGIKDQCFSTIVVTDAETELHALAFTVRFKPVRHLHGRPLALPGLLPRRGGRVLERIRGRLDAERPVLLERHRGCSPVPQPDLGGICTWSHHEFVFHPVNRTAVDQIDTGPEVAIYDLGKGGQPDFPLLLRSLEVAEDRLLLIIALRNHVQVRPHKLQLHGPSSVLALETEGDPIPRKEQRLVGTLDIVFHLVRVDTLVLHEVERELGESDFMR